MGILIKLCCDVQNCERSVALPAEGDIGDPIYMSEGSFIVETSWMRVPAGWIMAADRAGEGYILCPEHEAERQAFAERAGR